MHSYQDKINELNNLYNDGQFLNVAQKAAYYLKENENWFEVWNLLGASKFALGQFLGASEAFNKTISLNPSFVEGYVNLGLVLKNLNKLNDAIKCFRNAIRLSITSSL